jgi:hypothetical protein
VIRKIWRAGRASHWEAPHLDPFYADLGEALRGAVRSKVFLYDDYEDPVRILSALFLFFGEIDRRPSPWQVIHWLTTTEYEHDWLADPEAS